MQRLHTGSRAGRSLVLFLVLAAPGFIGLAHAVRIPGGGKAASDCYVQLEVQGDGTPINNKILECTDGATCDQNPAGDQCTFRVSLCSNQPDTSGGCTATPPLSAITLKKAASVIPLPPLDSAACGATTDIAVAVKVKKSGKKKAGKVKLPIKAKGTSAPKNDPDKITLKCLPGGTTSTTLPPGNVCPPNTSGPNEPNRINFKVKAEGTDLDNGWKGASFNFPTPANTLLQICLDQCDSTTDNECVTRVQFGDDTYNENFFGPPLPLIAAATPVCVLNRFNTALQPNSLGTANLETGVITGTINLLSSVYLSAPDEVCPRCNPNNSRCVGGPRDGQACTIDGTVTVAESTAANKVFNLSKDCPPFTDTLAGTLTINLPLTTGTSTLTPNSGGSAQTPCVRQSGEPAGLTPAPDSCPPGGTCNATCTGNSCTAMIADPVTGSQVCVASKGGLSQLCCSNETNTPCHPTRSGGVIERTGKAVVPTPTWPDPTYPKTTDGTVQVATFCEGATNSNSVNGITGLPGPGTLMLPVVSRWLRPADSDAFE
jgi:hypothetical protein